MGIRGLISPMAAAAVGRGIQSTSVQVSSYLLIADSHLEPRVLFYVLVHWISFASLMTLTIERRESLSPKDQNQAHLLQAPVNPSERAKGERGGSFMISHRINIF